MRLSKKGGEKGGEESGGTMRLGKIGKSRQNLAELCR